MQNFHELFLNGLDNDEGILTLVHPRSLKKLRKSGGGYASEGDTPNLGVWYDADMEEVMDTESDYQGFTIYSNDPDCPSPNEIPSDCPVLELQDFEKHHPNYQGKPVKEVAVMICDWLAQKGYIYCWFNVDEEKVTPVVTRSSLVNTDFDESLEIINVQIINVLN